MAPAERVHRWHRNWKHPASTAGHFRNVCGVPGRIPLVIFATFVGFQGAYRDGSIGNAFAGAIIITLGMFFPCFLFTIAGHKLLEKLVRNKVSEALNPYASLSP